MRYTDICEAKTQEEIVDKFDAICRQVKADNPAIDIDEIRKIQLSNVGYFAGYYDEKTYTQVMSWLGASHPIFGTKYPSPVEAFSAGCEKGRST